MDNWMEFETLEQQVTEIKLRFVEAMNEWKKEEDNSYVIKNEEDKEEDEIEYTPLSDTSDRNIIGNELEEEFMESLSLYQKHVQDNLVLDELYGHYNELMEKMEEI